jgi:hypothetical protein
MPTIFLLVGFLIGCFISWLVNLPSRKSPKNIVTIPKEFFNDFPIKKEPALDLVSCDTCKCLLKRKDAQKVWNEMYCQSHRKPYESKEYIPFSFDAFRYYSRFEVSQDGTPIGYKKIESEYEKAEAFFEELEKDIEELLAPEKPKRSRPKKK